MIKIYLAVEDDLSECVLRKILRERKTPYRVEAVFKKNGFGYLKKNCPAFNNLAKASPVLLLTDLDTNPCPPALIQDWHPHPMNPHFLFRVAVREVEAWLLAHEKALKTFLGLKRSLSHPEPEIREDPKADLLYLASLSLKQDVRAALIRKDPDGKLIQGPAYNSTLSDFVNSLPVFAEASDRCPSLSRLLHALERLEQ